MLKRIDIRRNVLPCPSCGETLPLKKASWRNIKPISIGVRYKDTLVWYGRKSEYDASGQKHWTILFLFEKKQTWAIDRYYCSTCGTHFATEAYELLGTKEDGV